jgi:hypothetical protein
MGSGEVMATIPIGRTPVSGIRLWQAGMGGHFKRAPCQCNMDCKWLDARQLRRLIRIEKRLLAKHPIGVYDRLHLIEAPSKAFKRTGK